MQDIEKNTLYFKMNILIHIQVFYDYFTQKNKQDNCLLALNFSNSINDYNNSIAFLYMPSAVISYSFIK